MCIANTGSLILVVTSNCQIFSWEMDQGQVLLSTKPSSVEGTWSQIQPEEGVFLPNTSNVEKCIHSVFSANNYISH